MTIVISEKKVFCDQCHEWTDYDPSYFPASYWLRIRDFDLSTIGPEGEGGVKISQGLEKDFCSRKCVKKWTEQMAHIAEIQALTKDCAL